VINFTNLCKHILINESNLEYEATLSINLRYCYSSRRATQNMSATSSSPTIGIILRGLPQAAVTVSLHYLPRCLRSVVTCGKQNAYHRDLKCIFQDLLHVIVTQQRPVTKQFAPEFRSLLLQAKKQIYGIASSSLHVTRTANLALVQCECHIGK